MNLKNLLAGITTLQPYYDNPDGYHLSAEHDQIWMRQTDKPLPPEVVQKMIDAKWFQEGAVYEDEFKAENYAPEESWTAYT